MLVGVVVGDSVGVTEFVVVGVVVTEFVGVGVGLVGMFSCCVHIQPESISIT